MIFQRSIATLLGAMAITLAPIASKAIAQDQPLQPMRFLADR
jgi:hypothetical protein